MVTALPKFSGSEHRKRRIEPEAAGVQHGACHRAERDCQSAPFATISITVGATRGIGGLGVIMVYAAAWMRSIDISYWREGDPEVDCSAPCTPTTMIALEVKSSLRVATIAFTGGAAKAVRCSIGYCWSTRHTSSLEDFLLTASGSLCVHRSRHADLLQQELGPTHWLGGPRITRSAKRNRQSIRTRQRDSDSDTAFVKYRSVNKRFWPIRMVVRQPW